MSDYVERYLKELKREFAKYGLKEQPFIDGLKEQGEELLIEKPNITYDDFKIAMGIPTEVIEHYLKQEENENLKLVLNKRKMVKKYFTIILIILIFVGGYFVFAVYKEAKESAEQRVTEIEYTIQQE